jgi:hypothetical protein
VTTRLSIVHELASNHSGVSLDPNGGIPGWYLDVAFLRRMWELGQDTILETAFYEPFEKSDGKFKSIEIDYRSA